MVLEGREADYIDWFLTSGTKDRRGVPADVRDAFVAAYRSRESLRCGFEPYRAFAVNAGQIRTAVADRPFATPTLAIVGGLVGDAFYRQLQPVAGDLRRIDVADCGHLVPLEQPQAFADALIAFDHEQPPR